MSSSCLRGRDVNDEWTRIGMIESSNGATGMGMVSHDSAGSSEKLNGTKSTGSAGVDPGSQDLCGWLTDSNGEGEEAVIERSGQREDGNRAGVGWVLATEGEGVSTTSDCVTPGELC